MHSRCQPPDLGVLAATLRWQRGSISAEFALALPAVCLVLAIALGALGGQVSRIKLVDAAAVAARAVARGEDSSLALAMASQIFSEGEFLISNQADLACVQASFSVRVAGLGANLLELTETQCSRKQGL